MSRPQFEENRYRVFGGRLGPPEAGKWCCLFLKTVRSSSPHTVQCSPLYFLSVSFIKALSQRLTSALRFHSKFLSMADKALPGLTPANLPASSLLPHLLSPPLPRATLFPHSTPSVLQGLYSFSARGSSSCWSLLLELSDIPFLALSLPG